MRNYLKDAVQHPDKIITNLGRRGLLNWMSDEQYLKLLYKAALKKKLNLDNPQTFNEKLQWLKLHDRNPDYTKMVDKYEAKKYVASIIGEEYIIPTLGVYDKFDDIDFDKLPNQFVIKCTHDSGGLVICKDKNTLDIKAARKKISKCLKRNFYYFGREWPYKNVKPRIIIEKYMVDESNKELKDYKVFNFDGKPKIIQVDYDRFVEHKRNLYDKDWKYIEAAIQYPTNPEIKIEKPKNLTKMLELAKILSKDIPHVRTDFYSIEDKIYFGELTFYSESGLGKFSPKQFEKDMGEWLKLPGGGYLLKNNSITLLINYDVKELKDYKIFCFNGKPEIVLVCSERFSSNNMCETFFDINWNLINVIENNHRIDKNIKKPFNLEKILLFATKLSQNISFLRVDFYEINDKIYFGELTFFPATGLEKFEPNSYDLKLGNLIDINWR